MKLLPTALFAMLLAYSPIAFCENWECEDGSYGFRHCIDLKSIKDDGAYRTAWAKLTSQEGAPIDEDGASYIKILASFDCNNNTAAFLSADWYDKDNKIMEGGAETLSDPVYRDVQPDFLYNHVCGK